MKTSETTTTSGTEPIEVSSGTKEVAKASQEIKAKAEKQLHQDTIAISSLKQLNPWPTKEPEIGHDWSGFFSKRHKNLFKELITDKTKVVVDLGPWLGKSSRFIAQLLPDDSTLICVDHWKGNQEFSENRELANKLPTAYETFIKNQWGLKDKTIAIKDSTLAGLRTIKMCGVKPQIIYIAAGNDYDNIFSDINLSMELFPAAILVVEGYMPEWPDIIKACDELAESKSYEKTIHKKLCILSRDND